MSAYVVDRSTFKTINTGLREFNTDKFPSVQRAIRSSLVSFEGAEALTKRLYALNVRAVNQRYGDSHSEEMPYPVEMTDTPVSIFQFLKSLECIHYQMSEGNVPEEFEYKNLKGLIDSIYYHIVSSMPLYQMATWG